MRESDLKRKLVKEVNAIPGGYARRVEDRWSVGALDLFIKLPVYAAMWAEAKVIDGNLFGPTARQYEEGKRLLAAHVPVLLIGWKNGVMYVSAWTEKADIRECYDSHFVGNFAQTLFGYMEHRYAKDQAS